MTDFAVAVAAVVKKLIFITIIYRTAPLTKIMICCTIKEVPELLLLLELLGVAWSYSGSYSKSEIGNFLDVLFPRSYIINGVWLNISTMG